jgi:lysyl-tRNA synthetase class 2
MAELPLIQLRNARLTKLGELRAMGINPYPSQTDRTQYAQGIKDAFSTFEGTTVVVAGRLVSLRPHGAITFGHIQDQTGRIQLYFKESTLSKANSEQGNIGYGELRLLDIGDFVEARGTVTKTQRGEVSILVDVARILAKSLRPLPSQWSGLKNRELILRKRYLDTIIEPQHKMPFAQISEMLFAIRSFLHQRGFLEFHTPVIQPLYGGGTAKPFVTHVNALDRDMFLSISHELYLKRLIAAGFDNVFTIGRYFRNEGIDRSHHPEFSMVETMSAYKDYTFNMDLIEELYRYVAEHAFGRTEFTVQGNRVNFSEPWRRVSMVEAVLQVTGVDFRLMQNAEEANNALARLNINEPQGSVGLALVSVFEACVEPTLVHPTLVYGHPVEISPLAKPMDHDPRFAERFEIFVGGMECGDNWSEQNDPVQLLEFWRGQFGRQQRQAEEIHPVDYDFIEVLEHGMPPTTGIGPGVERMAMIFTEQDNIDDVIFFPMLRPVLSQDNATIFDVRQEEAPPTVDVLVTFDEFASMLGDQTISSPQKQVLVLPHLRVWRNLDGHAWVTGHLEVTGLIPNQIVKIVGYRSRLSQPNVSSGDLDEYRAFIDRNVSDVLTAGGSSSIEISEADVVYR